jgi:hypothetical protein
MPTFQGLVTEEQVNALVAYIKALSPATSNSGAKTSAATPPVRDRVERNVEAKTQSNRSKGQ